MPTIQLQPDEAMILQEVAVAHNGNAYTDELYLTTKNIYCVNKGVFGKTKDIFCYPLNQLKKVDEYSPVMQGKKSNGIPVLEIYLVNGSESFSFRSNNESTIKKWIKEISNMLGYDIGDIDDHETLMGKLKGAFNDAMSEMGVNFQIGKKEAQTIINKKCISCSAPLIGYKGQLIHCIYCDTNQTL